MPALAHASAIEARPVVGAATAVKRAAIANVITLPMIFLAGVFFSRDTAPHWLTQVAKTLPLTYLWRTA